MKKGWLATAIVGLALFLTWVLVVLGDRLGSGDDRYPQLTVGDLTPDVRLYSLDGRPFNLKERINSRPLVLILADYT